MKAQHIQNYGTPMKAVISRMFIELKCLHKEIREFSYQQLNGIPKNSRTKNRQQETVKLRAEMNQLETEQNKESKESRAGSLRKAPR